MAIVFDLLVPGAGLIVLRREWLGMAVATLFALLVAIGLGGLVLMPAIVPHVACVGGLVAAGGVWCASKWLLIRWANLACGPRAQERIARMIRTADAEIEAGRLAEARDMLQAAFILNDENVEVLARLARLAGELGDDRAARKRWTRVARLARDVDLRDEAARHLASA